MKLFWARTLTLSHNNQERSGEICLRPNMLSQRESLMRKTSKLIQANLQHAKAASYTISRRFANELLNVALIQEPWTTEPGRINGLGNIPGKVMFHSLRNKPRACILKRRNINDFLLTDFCSEDVVTVQLIVPTDEGQ
ncbi:hypothetical protein JTB14_001102 [Gonioctena quinquepunctata]|nr:hypothetical protein JTB14_001102 [Gonioctena quinquepunctata]